MNKTQIMKNVLCSLVILVSLTSNLLGQKQHILKSNHLPAPDTVWVYTPPEYQSNPEKIFPVVYLLHGWNGSYHQWNDITDCQALADRYGFIIVCPDGLVDSWYINSPAISKSRYADFFFLDLMPLISEKYRTDPANVFITGLSMGGHGAIYLFAQKPGLFRSAGSLSGVLDLGFCWNEYGINKYLGITSQKTGASQLKSFSVTGNLNKIAGAGKEIIFTCGSSDRFYPLNNLFKKQCDEYKINATYIITPGGHDKAYWKSAIGFHFDFFTKKIKTGK